MGLPTSRACAPRPAGTHTHANCGFGASTVTFRIRGTLAATGTTVLADAIYSCKVQSSLPVRACRLGGEAPGPALEAVDSG